MGKIVSSWNHVLCLLVVILFVFENFIILFTLFLTGNKLASDSNNLYTCIYPSLRLPWLRNFLVLLQPCLATPSALEPRRPSCWFWRMRWGWRPSIPLGILSSFWASSAPWLLSLWSATSSSRSVCQSKHDKISSTTTIQLFLWDNTWNMF